MTRRDFILWGVRGLAAAVMIDAFWLEKAWIDWREYSIRKSAGAPTDLTLVQISDLHLSGVDRTLRAAAQKINALNPDLILVTGDSIDRRENLHLLDQFLGLLDKRIPKAAVLGNWEYWGNVDLAELEKTYAAHNGRLLVNSSAQYNLKGRSIVVTGFDDLIGNRPDPDQAFRDHRPNDYHIVLNHCPKFRDVMVEQASQWPPIDLVLAGHTHGGQINLLGCFRILPPGSGRYVRGWYREARPHMYVSGGVGVSTVPVRLGARAEMAVFRVSV
jgi:uncharacterized protein